MMSASAVVAGRKVKDIGMADRLQEEVGRWGDDGGWAGELHAHEKTTGPLGRPVVWRDSDVMRQTNSGFRSRIRPS